MQAEDRKRIRCSGCKLVQFVSMNKVCVRCKKSYIPAPPLDAPQPIKPLSVQTYTFWTPVLMTALRIEKGMSQADVARTWGGSKTFVSAYEMGKRNIDMSSVMRFVAAIAMKPAKFVRMTEFLVTGE